MALVRDFDELIKERNQVHGEAKATYTAFRSEDGQIYFQIDTYGSTGRKITGKQSQAFQVDETAARKLVELLKAEFGI